MGKYFDALKRGLSIGYRFWFPADRKPPTIEDAIEFFGVIITMIGLAVAVSMVIMTLGALILHLVGLI